MNITALIPVLAGHLHARSLGLVRYSWAEISFWFPFFFFFLAAHLPTVSSLCSGVKKKATQGLWKTKESHWSPPTLSHPKEKKRKGKWNSCLIWSGKNWSRHFEGFQFSEPKIVQLLRKHALSSKHQCWQTPKPRSLSCRSRQGNDKPMVSVQTGGREAGQSRGSSQGQAPGRCWGRRAGGQGQPQAAWPWTFTQSFAMLLLAATGKRASKPSPAVVPLRLQWHVGQRRILQPYWNHFRWLKHHLPIPYACIDSPYILIFLYRKHCSLEKFILTAVCLNISLLH